MASKKVIAAIKGSIANPEAAELVLAAIDAASQVEALEDTVAAAAAVAPIADPSTATAEDVATKLNALIAALQG